MWRVSVKSQVRSVKFILWSLKSKLWGDKCRVWSLPHNYGDATGIPETWDETRGCKKKNISCGLSSNFDIFGTLSNRLECHKVPRLPRKTIWQLARKHSKRSGVLASPIDTEAPQENQRLETRHVDTEKPTFRTRLPQSFKFVNIIKQVGMSESATPASQNGSTTCVETFEKDRFCIFPHRHGEATGKPDETGEPKRACRARPFPSFTFWSFKIDVFLRFSLELEFWTSKSMFPTRLPWIFTTSHKIPRMPRNLHLVATWRSPANAMYKKTQNDTFQLLRLPGKMTMDTSKVLRLPRKMQDILWKRRESIGPATKNGLGVEETEFCRQVKRYFLAYNMEFEYGFYYVFWQGSYVST